MKSAETRTNGLPAPKPVKYANHFTKISDRIAEKTIEGLDSGKMGTVEAAGHISMANLLAGVADGSITQAKSYAFLKSLAEKKTPNPVQQIETHSTIDMRALIIKAVADNPDKLRETLAIAVDAREQVRKRIGASDNALELKPLQATDSPEVQSLESNPLQLKPMDRQTPLSASWKPGDSPPEITKLNENS